MSVKIDKVDNGYITNVDYPEATPARRRVHEEPKAMIEEVLITFGLMERWDRVAVTITSPAGDDWNGPHPETVRVL